MPASRGERDTRKPRIACGDLSEQPVTRASMDDRIGVVVCGTTTRGERLRVDMGFRIPYCSSCRNSLYGPEDTMNTTLEDLFGITSIHEYIQNEISAAHDDGTHVNHVAAEEGLRDSLDAYLPYGYVINADDIIEQITDEPDTLNPAQIRVDGAQVLQYFDVADYVD